MPKLRLFLSLNPAENIISELALIQRELKSLYPSGNIRWEEPDKFHLTLRFLGDVNEIDVEPLSETLQRLKFGFELILFEAQRVGFFPETKFPNVIYAGFKESGNNSDVLVGFIDRIIHNFGVKPEKRFIPHITLGRFNRSKRVKISEPADIEMSNIKAEFDSFCLMQSKLTPSGSVYETLNKFNFRK